MQDLFGREVKRGDIIAFSDNNRSGQCNYKSARLGIVNNILGNRKFKKGSSFHTKVQNRFITAVGNTTALIPDEIELNEVVTFYQFFEQDSSNSMQWNLKKNGKPKRSINLTTQFIIIDESQLNESWLNAYKYVKQIFKI